jgi:DNA-binding response OmpR family regulator
VAPGEGQEEVIPVSEDTAIEAAAGPGAAAVRVLVVDADPADREWVARVLQSRYNVHFAQGMHEALDAIARARPDLEVSEVELADGDGFQLCSQLRRQPDLRELPILLLTRRSSTADKVRGFQVGADDYVVKPVAEQVLCARLRLLGRIKSIEPPALLGEVS